MAKLDWAWLFGNPFLSDCTVELDRGQGTSASASFPQRDSIQLPGHAVLLAHSSPLLRSLLEACVCSDNAASAGQERGAGGGRVVRLPVGPGQEHAGLVVLRGMYDPHSLGCRSLEMQPELLVAALRLADQWQADLVVMPPELTARHNKKLLTLEEISQAHASSVYSQKYSIEVVGGKIKAVCNDCKMALSCGNLSDARKHQCNKRPRSDQHAIAGGTSSDMLFERITACWNPDQRMPANIMAEFWRRIHMWFIDAEIPFAKVDNPWLRDALTLAGIGMMSERSLLTSQLLLRYQEVQGKVAWQNWSSLLPDGGRIFHDVKDVSDLKKDAVGIKDLLQSWPDELRSAGHPVPAIKGWVMDNTSTNKRAMQLMEDDDPEAINMGCAGQELQALALAEERRAQAQQQQQQHTMPLLQQPGMAHPPGQVQQPGMAHPPGQVQQLTPTYGAAMAELLSHAHPPWLPAGPSCSWSAWGRLFTSARTRVTLERAKMLIYIEANAGLGARRSNEAQLLARMGE
ncbi:hypothetical protein QJQ45_020258 [Haematococcus lacustris]|nr:hypothetical protein QJQ45_020258 [Haematococcus lacustris]